MILMVLWSTGAAAWAGTGDPITAQAKAAAILQKTIQKGKKALVARDTLRAYQLFQKAVALKPTHPEARFYLGVTRLLSWPMRRRRLFKQAGLQGPAGGSLNRQDLNPLRFIAILPDTVLVPEDVSTGGEAQTLAQYDLWVELQSFLKHLSYVTSGFASTLPLPNPLTGSPEVELDDADVALLRAAAQLAIAQVHLSLVYDVDVDIHDLVGQAEAGTLDVESDVLAAYPAFLRLQRPPHATLAKDALIAALDHYLAAEQAIERETDPQGNDLISFSSIPEDVNKRTLFHQAASDLKRSLQGLSDPAWTLTVDQLLHLGEFFDDPVDLRSLETGQGIQQALVRHVEHQSARAITNLHKAAASYSEQVDRAAYGDSAGGMLEIDYGDLLAVESALHSLHAITLISDSYNVDVRVADVLEPAIDHALDIDEALAAHPAVLREEPVSRLTEAQGDLWAALQALLDSSRYLRQSDDPNQADDLIRYEGALAALDAQWRPQLEQFQGLMGVLDPDPAETGDEFRVDLTRLGSQPLDPRDLLPAFDGARPRRDTLPDPTLAGILPDTTLDDWPE
ncbi:MAG: hypothetical protein HYZ96_03260 [Candidatus Omnitrophica bacterium]|nr:hypothetical protein [Candidatus Omnitrophota bacterium]